MKVWSVRRRIRFRNSREEIGGSEILKLSHVQFPLKEPLKDPLEGPLRGHVLIWYIYSLASKYCSPYIGTLGPKYILFEYMDPYRVLFQLELILSLLCILATDETKSLDT